MKRTLLTVEQLETREVPAVFGNAWPEAGNLSLSFAPDGTKLGSSTSRLSDLAAVSQLSEATVRRETLRAFQTWASVANINFHVVGDFGRPFGEAGPLQGKLSAGDIRIGATNLSESALAVGTPFDLFSSWSGSVVLNDQYKFSVGNTESSFDLYSVILHEGGHVLGLGPSDDPGSIMYEAYVGVRNSFSSEDVQDIRALYGKRKVDRFEGIYGNNSFATASVIKPVTLATLFSDEDLVAGSQPYVVEGDLTHSSDLDYFKFTLAPTTTSFKARLKTSDLSLLTARLTLFDASHNPIKSVAAVNPENGDLSIEMDNAAAGGTYYVRVSGSGQDVFRIGAYRLSVGTAPDLALYKADPAQQFVKDGGTNDQRETATILPSSGFQEHAWETLYRGSIGNSGDVDYYKITAPVDIGDNSTMVISVWAQELNKLDPNVLVYDANGTQVPVEILSNTGHLATLQVREAKGGSTYYLRMAATNPSDVLQTGNYTLGVDFRSEPIEMEQFALAELSQTNQKDNWTLQSTNSQLFHFNLSVGGFSPNTNAIVVMTILDQENREISTSKVGMGQTLSIDVLLRDGTYTVRFRAVDPTGQTLPDLIYSLRGTTRSAPIGPELEDPTGDPIGSPELPPPPESVPPQEEPITWSMTPLDAEWLAYEDPYSDPWSSL